VTIRAELPPVETEAQPPSRHRSWKRIAVVTAALLIVGSGVSTLIYVNTYQPLGPAGFSQDSPEMRQNVVIVTDGVGDDTYVAVGAPATTATVDYTIANNGRFDITVLGPADSEGHFRMKLQWAPAMVALGGGATTNPTLAQARSFPATIKAHQAIQLFVSVEKPGCAAGYTQKIVGVPIRWKALGVHHVTTLELDPESHYLPIAVCAPKAALRNTVS
jgi:hypothetical protein